jgi:uncharacterized protein (DUF433 family)
MDLSSFIVRDPKICGGQWVFRGTRILVRTVLESFAEGDSEADVLSGFPTLTREHLRAALELAAAAGGDDDPRRG